MEQILEKLGQTSGITGCFLAGLDGLVVAGELRNGRDKDLLAATASDLYRDVSSAFEKIDDAVTQTVAIERTSEKIFIHRIEGTETLLVALSEPRINLGLVRMEIQQAAVQLKKHL